MHHQYQGTLLNLTFPNWLILLLMVILLSVTVHRTAKKGITLWKNEKKKKEGQIKTVKEEEGRLVEEELQDGNEEAQFKYRRMNEILKHEENTHVSKILMLMGILLVIFALTFLKGPARGTCF
jgi:uncharacterized protein YpmS